MSRGVAGAMRGVVALTAVVLLVDAVVGAVLVHYAFDRVIAGGRFYRASR